LESKILKSKRTSLKIKLKVSSKSEEKLKSKSKAPFEIKKRTTLVQTTNFP
jgi:hypothetical protein